MYMTPEDRANTIYVVRAAEEDLYRNALAKKFPEVNVLPCVGAGIAETRQIIGQFAAVQGEDKFFMIDDDCRFYVRRSPEEWNLIYMDPSQYSDLMLLIETLLDDYGHVGVSPREGNNRLGAGDRMHIVENTRTLLGLAYRPADFLACEHGRVVVMEDFDVNLQLLEKGIPNCNIVYYAQGQRVTNAPGGCSTYRSHAVQDAAARRLAELHPGIVRLRTKENISGGEFGTRTEVTIAWKKAFDGSGR